MLRDAARFVARPIQRRRRNLKWESKWQNPGDRFGWNLDQVAHEVRAAFSDGWIAPGALVLDVGCGSGDNAAWLAEQGCVVTGIDVAETAIAQATAEFGDIAHLDFAAADVTQRDVLADRTFDAILDRGCLHGIPPELRSYYARNLRAWTVAGSRLLLMMHLGSGQVIEERARQVHNALIPPFELVGARGGMTLGEIRGSPINGAEFRLLRA